MNLRKYLDKVRLPVKGQFFLWHDNKWNYINDFSNISTVTWNISTIFLIYRRFDTGYRLTDKSWQKIIPILLRACKCEIAQDFILYVAKVVWYESEECKNRDEKNGMLIDFCPDIISLIPTRIKKQLRINCTYGRSEKWSVIWI